MPFTLAHPAILFPLLKKHRYFSATALVVGSMVPDVEFIAQLQESSTYSHKFPGIFLINFPLGLLLCWLFHAVIKFYLIPNLPINVHKRFSYILNFDWLYYAQQNKLTVVSSLGMGILSHFVWDAFTHSDGFFVLIWPVLNNPISILQIEMPMYHFLQIISSVIGLALFVYMIWQLPKFPIAHHVSINYWLSFSLLVAILMIIRFLLFDFNNGFWDVVLGFKGIGLYAVIINSFCHLLWLRKPEMLAP